MRESKAPLRSQKTTVKVLEEWCPWLQEVEKSLSLCSWKPTPGLVWNPCLTITDDTEREKDEERGREPLMMEGSHTTEAAHSPIHFNHYSKSLAKMCEHSCSLDHEPRERRRVREDQLHLSMWASLWGKWSKTWWNRKWREETLLSLNLKEKTQHEDKGRNLWKQALQSQPNTTESNHLDFSVPQIWLQKHKVNQGATQHENITVRQRTQTTTPTSNRIHYSTGRTWLD